jgi:recombination associated protein RdgC
MFFRNLTLFRFPTTLKLSRLESHLADCALKPAGPLELSSRGFVSPFGRDGETLMHKVGDCVWLTVGGEERLLPSSVVNEEAAKKIAKAEHREGRKLGSRARRKIKEDIIHDLLPRAFVRPVRTDAYLDLQHGFIAVDTSSRKNAEEVVAEVRRALGSFPSLPLNSEVSPRSVLTGWIAGEKLPKGVALGDECELRDPADRGAIVKCQRQELQGEEIAKHLESGKQAARLALGFDDHVSFVLGEDLVVRKLKFLDGAVDELENTERESVAAELDARFALMSAELKRVFAMLEKAFKLSRAEA